MGVSCCGQAKDDPGVTNTQPFLGAGPGIIDSQPSYQPVLNYNNNGFQPPSVPSPPIAHPPDHNTFSNGFQPPVREFGAASPLQQPSFTGTTYNGSNFDVVNGFSSINQSIARPKSSHSPHSPPPKVNAPTQDEGKMSVSIDFGVYPHATSLHSLILIQVQHFLVL